MFSFTICFLWKLLLLLLKKRNMYFQGAAWSCSWDLHSSHYIYAGLQVWPLIVFLYLANPGLIFYFLFSLSCRMAPFWCLICARLLGLFIPWGGWHAILCIPFTHFYIVQLLLLALGPSYLLRRLACVGGFLVVLHKGRLLSSYVCMYALRLFSSFLLSYKAIWISYWYPLTLLYTLTNAV